MHAGPNPHAKYKAVLKLAGVTPPEKLVLYTLTVYADRKGECYPSTRTIVENTGLSRASVFRALTGLEAKGHISRKSGKKAGKVTVYRVSHTETPPVSQRDTPQSHGETPGVSQRDTEQTIGTGHGEQALSNSRKREDYNEDQVQWFMLLLPNEEGLSDQAFDPSSAMVGKLQEHLEQQAGYRGSTRHSSIRASLAEAADRLQQEQR